MKHAGVGRSVPIEFPAPAVALRHKAADYLALTKPRVNLLVIATSAAGFYAGARGRLDIAAFVHALMGTAFVAGGASGLNQIYERNTDLLMQRTRLRPLPDGRLSAGEARVFSIALSALGLAQLAFGVNLLAAAVALVTLIIYIAVYTPMKLRSPVATLIGAVPGALPPLIGWASARGTLSFDAWTLFAIVFCWQIPHFYAIAWLHREDYQRAGFRLLPVIEPTGRRAGRQAAFFGALLPALAIAPFFTGLAGSRYLMGALLLSAGLFVLAARFALQRSTPRARWLFFGSLVYLPGLWALLLIDLVGR